MLMMARTMGRGGGASIISINQSPASLSKVCRQAPARNASGLLISPRPNLPIGTASVATRGLLMWIAQRDTVPTSTIFKEC